MFSFSGSNTTFRLNRGRSLSLVLLISLVYTVSYLLWDVGDLEEEELFLDLPGSSNETEFQSVFPNDRHMYLPLLGNAVPKPKKVSLPPEVAILCLESMLVTGEYGCEKWDPTGSIDIAWSWVNSSDRVWRYTYDTIEHQAKGLPGLPKINYQSALAHFRDYDELRHSMRSVLRHFRPYVHRFNLLASDFRLPDELREYYNITEHYRIGQLPAWLDPSRQNWQDQDIRLSMRHHSTFFYNYTDTVFSSFAIESHLRNLQGITNVFLYLNDDMYFLKDFHPADFFTRAYGFVFRVDPTIEVPSELDSRPQRGEWQPLRESNVALSGRFGVSKRPYVNHMPKVMSIPILQELAASFPEAFARTGGRAFREVWLEEPGDIHTAFMFPHFVIERWREALLWSWTVARIGGDDDSWDATMAWAALGGGEDGTISVGSISRETLDTDRVLENLQKLGYSSSGATDYHFGSGDGYPFYNHRRGGHGYPNLESSSVCKLERETCFPSFTNASTAFQHIAFSRPECGDCVINRLVQRSGRLGLSEVLPPARRAFAAAARGPTPDTLPLAADWRPTSFSLARVLHQAPDGGVVNLRNWMLRVLDRYRFVLGETASEFAFLTGPSAATKAVSKLKPGSDIAFACMNDDVSGDGSQVQKIMLDWQEERWPERGQWEAR